MVASATKPTTITHTYWIYSVPIMAGHAAVVVMSQNLSASHVSKFLPPSQNVHDNVQIEELIEPRKTQDNLGPEQACRAMSRKTT
jgi:hypothetical protein